MAVTRQRVAVRIGSVVVPRGRGFDASDLGARVETELRDLLEREPLRSPSPLGGTVSMPGGRVVAPSLGSPATVARALARHVHDRLRAEERRR